MPLATSKQRWLRLFTCFVANEPQAPLSPGASSQPASLGFRLSDASDSMHPDGIKQAGYSGGRRRPATQGEAKRMSGESAYSGSSKSDTTQTHGHWTRTSGAQSPCTGSDQLASEAAHSQDEHLASSWLPDRPACMAPPDLTATEASLMRDVGAAGCNSPATSPAAEPTRPTPSRSVNKPNSRLGPHPQQAASPAPCEETPSTARASLRLDPAQDVQLPAVRTSSCEAPTSYQAPPCASSCCGSTATSTAGFGIYSALVAERRAKVAAAALAAPATTCPLSLQHGPATPPLCPSAAHRRLAPIVTSLPPLLLSSPCAGTSPAGSLGVSQSGGTGSPLCGILDANASAFLSAVQEPIEGASPGPSATHLLTPASLEAFNAVSSCSGEKSRHLSSWGSSSYEATHPPPTQHAVASHQPGDLCQQQAVTGLQQLPSSFPAASQQVPAAPSRLGLQAWQQPQAHAACSPQLALRVEALRHKLRSQSAELKTIAEQQQRGVGKRGPCPSALGVATPSAHASSGASWCAGRSPAALATPAFEFPQASPPVVTPGQRGCCRALEEEEGEEEEERSRHESTMSYLRMLSRSNTSFCTRLRRSNTQGHDAFPKPVSTCASFVTKRSILGSMDEIM